MSSSYANVFIISNLLLQAAESRHGRSPSPSGTTSSDTSRNVVDDMTYILLDYRRSMSTGLLVQPYSLTPESNLALIERVRPFLSLYSSSYLPKID